MVPQEQKNDIDLIDNNLLQSILQINTDMLDTDGLQSHSQIEELPTNEIEEVPVSEDIKDISISGVMKGIPTPEQMEEYRNNTVKELKDIFQVEMKDMMSILMYLNMNLLIDVYLYYFI